jgi:PAS domain S-box-containing protein
VRMLLKSVRVALDAGDLNAALSDASALIDNVTDLLYKEEDAFFPLCLETLTERDWIVCRLRGDEVGYAFVTPGDRWPEGKITLDETDVIRPGNKSGEIPLHTGSLDLEQLSLLLNNLPFDITFADENDIVRYYNNPKERVFERSPDIIGRTVQDCHQDASVPQVNKIINAFKAGERHDAELWITHHGKFVHIRYFAIRDIGGDYRGVMEIAQDVTAIRALEGERRKLDW